ncbi:hypothetical protein QTG56_24425 (plasmid) [Rossellomorea sp. AcN35-11]|nr:hypothetical protein [Rossellomorea aquimaris]WJV31781.1 hypothetical protein QTG56_24425 [Rossellomorea sp. AcN35-11]
MIKVYNGENEVLNGIQKTGELEGVVAFELHELINKNIDQFDDEVKERLVGTEFAHLVYTPSYSIAGVNVETNSVLVNVKVDALELLKRKGK